MATVSRLVLAHPALGTAGGAALHTAVEALYQKIGDAISSRWYQLVDFDQAETVDLEHNFDTDIANLRWDLYIFTGGQWTLVTEDTSPARSAFTVIEKVGFEDLTLQITNNTGGDNLLAAVVITNDPIRLRSGDVADVTVTSPSTGDTLVYNSITGKFANQPATAVAKGYTKYVGSSETYTTLAAALAAASAGDWILVRQSTTEAGGDLSISVADVRIECAPGAVVAMSGAMTNGLRLTAARIHLENFRLSLAPSGAQARGISIEAADCKVEAQIAYGVAQTLTDAVHITTSGSRSYVRVAVNRTAGTISELLNNQDGASSAEAWGG